MEPGPGHTQGEAEGNTSDSLCLSIGFRFSEYISRSGNDTDGDIGKEERINSTPLLADSSAGIIAVTALPLPSNSAINCWEV